MNFWKRVDFECKLQGIERKQIAFDIGFDESNISKGIANASIPAADTALKISNYLNVSMEYLLNGVKEQDLGQINNIPYDYDKLSAYADTMYKMSTLSESSQVAISHIIDEAYVLYHSSKKA